jgi:predicted acyl esterase
MRNGPLVRNVPGFPIPVVLFVFWLCLPHVRAQPAASVTTAAPAKSAWQVQEFMVPMRDGVHLQTVVISHRDQTTPLPILLTRTPCGAPTQEEFDKAAAKFGADWLPPDWKELAADGYIFVFQNLRGRFKSEGIFLMTEQYDSNDPK